MLNLDQPVQYLPGWLPGTGFKQAALELHRDETELNERPFAFSIQKMAC